MTQFHGFQAWLDEATRDLCDEARARVERELLAHYEDAVRSAIASGATEADAHAEVLARLGDADAARKGYNDAHLTRDEESALKDRLAISGRQFLFQLTALVAVSLNAANAVDIITRYSSDLENRITQNFPTASFTMLAMILCAVGLGVYGVVAVRVSHKRSDLRSALRWYRSLWLVSGFIFGASYFAASLMIIQSVTILDVTVGMSQIVVGALAAIFESRSLARKLSYGSFPGGVSGATS
ncbi:MAG: hypothetical protein HZB26_06370 [Candidatus Hydrogenedentes bacterium]|nr:hypothetical protein [Candidatus Hydrogenedentota bacterium]